MYRKMWKLIITSFIIFELLPFVSPVLPVFNNEFMETKEEQRNYDEYPNLSTNEEEASDGRRKIIDPYVSWNSLHRPQKSDRNKKNRNKRKRLTCPPGRLGPAGPPGPRGPPGPPGAMITKEEMIKEFRELVASNKVTDKQSSGLSTEKCPTCTDTNNTNTETPNVEQKVEVITVPRIPVGFYLHLRRNVVVTGRTFMELESFTQPFAAGAFQRGDAFNVKNGRFVAPTEGIYQFSANIHMRVKKKRRRVKLKKRDTVTTQICIDSRCNQFASLRHFTGLESNSKIFTVSFHGFLHLRTGQYTSIYVDNASNLNVVVQSGSEFMGVMIGH